MKTNELTVLEVSASARRTGSASRELTRDLIDALDDRYGDLRLLRRDLGDGMPFVGEAWIDIEIIAADRLNSQPAESMAAARSRIADLIHLAPQAA